MRAAVMSGYGGPEVISVREIAAPVQGRGEVLIDVKAAGLNPVDVKQREGKLRAVRKLRFPQVIGNELAGTVSAVGAGVTRFKAGDAVFGRVDSDRLGAFAEQAVMKESLLCQMPPNLSFVQAASLPLVALTAYQGLVSHARLQPGEKVLIKAGSGGLGSFAVQYAKALGAQVATTAGGANVAWVRALGADLVVDYKQQSYEDVLSGYDVAFETVDAEPPQRSIPILKRGGRLVSVVGPPDRSFARAHGYGLGLQLAMAFMSRKVTRAAAAAGVHYTFFFVKASGDDLSKLSPLLASGAVKPVIDRVFALAQVNEALAYVATGRSKGKVVLAVAD